MCKIIINHGVAFLGKIEGVGQPRLAYFHDIPALAAQSPGGVGWRYKAHRLPS